MHIANHYFASIRFPGISYLIRWFPTFFWGGQCEKSQRVQREDFEGSGLTLVE